VISVRNYSAVGDGPPDSVKSQLTGEKWMIP
jgi:hypothetical protein